MRVIVSKRIYFRVLALLVVDLKSRASSWGVTMFECITKRRYLCYNIFRWFSGARVDLSSSDEARPDKMTALYIFRRFIGT